MKNETLVNQYKAMAKDSPANMEAAVENYLEGLAKSSPAFAAKYSREKLSGCFRFIVNCAREILGGKSGNVPDEVCYKMARDYFEDSLWNESEAPKGSEAAPVDDDEAEVAEAIEAQKNAPEVEEKAPKNKKAPAVDVVPEKKLKKADPIPEQLDLFGEV